MPKVNTDSSVRWNRCGLRMVPGQNSSLRRRARIGAQLAEYSSLLPQ